MSEKGRSPRGKGAVDPLRLPCAPTRVGMVRRPTTLAHDQRTVTADPIKPVDKAAPMHGAYRSDAVRPAALRGAVPLMSAI